MEDLPPPLPSKTP